jgi:hypothetical protein
MEASPVSSSVLGNEIGRDASRRPVGRRLAVAILLVASSLSLATGCDWVPQQSGSTRGGASGTIDIALAGAFPPDVTGVRIDVQGTSGVVASKTVAVDTTGGQVGPPADAFFVLPPGTYTVIVTPVAGRAPARDCSQNSATAVVTASITTEITVPLICKGPQSGGLDVSVTTSSPPVINDLTFDPSKFVAACQPVTITVAASDPQNDALTYAWKILSGPTTPGNVELDPQAGPSALFFSENSGDFTLEVDVTNTQQQTSTLSFPIHVLPGDPTTCSSDFNRLNPFTPPGPAVPGLVYGTRIHLDPAPGAVLPDPVCNLTNHGGPTLPFPLVHPIRWDSTVSSTFTSVTSLFGSLFGDPTLAGYLQILEQYVGPPSAPGGMAAAEVTLMPNNTATSLSPQDIQAELAGQFIAGNLLAPIGGVHDVYVVYLPDADTATHPSINGTGTTLTSCGDFFGYHGSFSYHQVDAEFVVLPGCGNASDRQVTASHELIEAMTDPLIGFVGGSGSNNLAWYDDQPAPCNGEVADLCEGNDYNLNGFQVASAWSDATASCAQAIVNEQLFAIFTDSGFGGNCTSGTDTSKSFGGACPTGMRQVSLDTTNLSMSNDTTCTAHWAHPGSTDCTVIVDYHIPQDCFKGIHCSTQAFVGFGALPAVQPRAILTQFDGNNLTGVDHTYTVGGPCDPGYIRPVTAPSAVVISGSPDAVCSTTYATTDPNDCTVNLEIITPADITKNITCQVTVFEDASP